MKTFKVTLKSLVRPHRGRQFTYTVEASDPAAAVSWARERCWAEDRVGTTSAVRCEEVAHEAA
jgi:hypothetical protein